MIASHAGRVAVVTGAANGLGQAYAQRLAADGAAVAIVDIDATAAAASAAEIVDAGGHAEAFACDVSQPQEVARMAQEVATRVGPVAILVNNAGVSPHIPFDEVTFADWERVMAINAGGQFLTVKAFVGSMRELGFGRIVNISSNTYGLVIAGFAHYMASKGAVIGLTRALATDLGPDGITVNAIAPGLTVTENTQRMWAGTTFFADMAETQAIKRPEVPSDLAGVVSFLASDDAGFVTGQTIVVDGGLVRH